MGRQPFPGRGVPLLGGFAEGEQRLPAAGRPTGPGDSQDLVEREVGRVEAGRRLGEGAVAAPVAAQHRQRYEHLGGECDPIPVGGVAPAGRLRHQLRKRCPEKVVRVEGGSGGHGATGYRPPPSPWQRSGASPASPGARHTGAVRECHCLLCSRVPATDPLAGHVARRGWSVVSVPAFSSGIRIA